MLNTFSPVLNRMFIPHHKLFSVITLLNLFAQITSVQLMTELNSPTAEEKLYWAESMPCR